MSKRSIKTWENKFKCVKAFMGVMDTFDVIDNDLIETCSTMLRNPIVFDNNIEEVKMRLPYHIEGMENENTEDHLIGMSNMVLYIFKNRLHDKWDTVSDFKKTLKTLNLLLPVTKELNDKGKFKGGWKFNYDNIDECVNWNMKLKSVNITHLICNETGKKVCVDKVWNEWNKSFKK